MREASNPMMAGARTADFPPLPGFGKCKLQEPLDAIGP